MNHAARLGNIIDLVGHNFDKVGFKAFDQTSELKSLRRINVNFTTSVSGMNTISHIIEEEATSFGIPFRFYSAFQRFSRVKPQAPRYLKILKTQNPLYLFGVPDVVLWKASNLTEVALEEPVIPGYPYLANHWFVMMHNPDYTSMALVCREITDSFTSLKLENRKFEGFWTYDKTVISQVVTVLDEYIEERVGPQILNPFFSEN